MDWSSYRLGDICTFINGRAYLQPELQERGKYPIVRVGNLSEANDSWYYSDMELPEEKYCNTGDLLYSWACNFGPYIWNGSKTIFHYHIWKVIPKTSFVDKFFLYYLLRNYTSSLMGLVHGSTMIHITKENMENIIVSIPTSIEDQIKCVKILRDLDRKIELNKSINANLEAMAKQLYDYWFVQFDFPDENGRPYKSSGGKMVWNEKLKREIPEGWSIKSLDSFFSVINRRTSSSKICKDDHYAPIDVLPRNRMSFSGCAPIENATSGLCMFEKRDILLSNRRVYFHKVCIAPFSGITRDTVIILRPDSRNLGYCYQLVNEDIFIEFATRNSYGTEQPVLSWEVSKMYFIPVSDNGIDLLYSKYVQDSIETILRSQEEIAELIKLRDELLPLLMNGQVSIKD